MLVRLINPSNLMAVVGTLTNLNQSETSYTGYFAAHRGCEEGVLGHVGHYIGGA